MNAATLTKKVVELPQKISGFLGRRKAVSVLANSDLHSFQEVFNVRLRSYLAEKISAYKGIADIDVATKSVEHALSLIEGGGKRVRPYMAFLAYHIEGGTDQEEVFRIGIGLELFHVFALIHDDIIDRGKERHGRATTHEYVAGVLDAYPRGEKAHLAQGFAMLAGDLVFSWASEIMSSSENRVIRDIYHRMVDEVVAGQMIDMSLMLEYQVKTDVIMRKNDLKTALYSFVQPLRIGAALASSTANKTFYEELGLMLGRAFQMQDDLLDIIGTFEKTGKVPFIDIQDGQHTLLTQYIFEQGKTEEREILMSLFGKPLDEHGRNVLSRLFAESGAITHTEKEIATHIASAKSLVTDSNLKQEHKETLIVFIERLAKRVS